MKTVDVSVDLTVRVGDDGRVAWSSSHTMMASDVLVEVGRVIRRLELRLQELQGVQEALQRELDRRVKEALHGDS